ncbi:MAG: DUF5686 family protein [Bacteroidaceae bacterium]
MGKTFAQVVQGRVVDASSGEALPLVYVYYADRRSEVVETDMQGRYSIPFRRGTLMFSMVGYESRAVEIRRAQKMDVRLREKHASLKEVKVEARRKRYSRKDNPAVEMMRRVIKAKEETDIRSRDYLSYHKYEKMTMSLDEVTEKILQDEHFRRVPYLKEHVDTCPQTGQLILPLTVDEKASRVIYRREPLQEKSIVEGQRSDGITQLISTGNILTGMLADCFTDVDLYQDQIRLFQYPFTSPVSSSSAISFYRYFIADTLMVERDKCYRVEFTPNNPQDFGFSGSLFILADSTWRLRRAEIGIPSRSDVNWVREMRLEQDFLSLPTGEQVVACSRMLVRLAITSWIQKLQVERVVHSSGWDFSPIGEKEFAFGGEEREQPSARMRDDTFWQETRPEPLTRTENDMGLMLRQFYATRGFKPLLWVAKAFIENYVETSVSPDRPSKVDIGPINSMIGSNFVEGFRLRASAQTTANLNRHWFLKGNVKYGFSDKRWKGMGELTYSFNRKAYLPHEYPVRNISFGYERDVASPSDKFLSTDKDNVFVALKWTPVRHMQYFERYNLRAEWEWENGMRLQARVRREWNEGAGHLFYQPMNGLTVNALGQPVPTRDDGLNLKRVTFSELTAGLRYQPGATYVNTKQHRLSTNNDSPVFELTHTTGIRGFLGGQYNYNFSEAGIYKRFWLRSWGKMETTLKGGIQWNRVPYPFLIMPAANTSYIMSDGTFSLIRNMEFPTDRYASLMLSWDMNGKVFNRIPLLQRLKWREYLGVNTLWGKLSDKNNPMLERNASDSRLFYLPGSFVDGEFEYASRVISPHKPYVEVIVGVHNIFKVFHVEYVQRLNYIYPGTHRWGIRGLFRATF